MTKTKTTMTMFKAAMVRGKMPPGIKIRHGRPAGILPPGYARRIGLIYSDGSAACGCDGGGIFCAAHPGCGFDN